MNKEILEQLGSIEEQNRIFCGRCPICNSKVYIDELRNLLSVKELLISGLCQKCQDKIFGVD